MRVYECLAFIDEAAYENKKFNFEQMIFTGIISDIAAREEVSGFNLEELIDIYNYEFNIDIDNEAIDGLIKEGILCYNSDNLITTNEDYICHYRFCAINKNIVYKFLSINNIDVYVLCLKLYAYLLMWIKTIIYHNDYNFITFSLKTLIRGCGLSYNQKNIANISSALQILQLFAFLDYTYDESIVYGNRYTLIRFNFNENHGLVDYTQRHYK